jgi:hypothetical protein
MKHDRLLFVDVVEVILFIKIDRYLYSNLKIKLNHDLVLKNRGKIKKK